MDKLRIALFGFDSYVSQIPRYREAFIELDPELRFDYPNILYANESTGYADAIKLQNTFHDAWFILPF